VPLPTWPPLWATTLRQRSKKSATIDQFPLHLPDVHQRRPRIRSFMLIA
jgi:hypothetical protein